MISRLVLCLAVVAAAPASRPQSVLGQMAITAETAQKPQSKLWYDQGTWWAALPQEKGVMLWRYADGRFEPQETPGALKGTRANSECDVLFTGGTLFVLSYARNPNETTLHALKFDRGAYRELAGYPVTLPYTGRAATMTCDVDSNGTLWAAYVSDRGKAVVHTFQPANPAAGFSAPIEVGTTPPGNIAAVKAFKGHVGVMWSDQKGEKFVFRVHRDDSPSGEWQPEEVALAGKDLVNDHLNMAADAAGTVWAVTKAQTGPNRPAAAMILSRRTPDGRWRRVASLLQAGQNKTRPIVVLDAEKPFAYVIYTDRLVQPNVIRLTPVSLPDGKFGKEIEILRAAHSLNNATACKVPVTEAMGLMVVAGAKDPKQGPALFSLWKLKDLR